MPSHTGISRPEQSDLNRAVRKATRKLDRFNDQVSKVQVGAAGEGPLIAFTTHPGLTGFMSTDWFAAMDGWLPDAKAQILQGIANRIIKFGVTSIGSVMTECVVNGKNTRLTLFPQDRSQPREWFVMIEPLANSADESFHAASSSSDPPVASAPHGTDVDTIVYTQNLAHACSFMQ